ncbi:MAG TPA: hypothetical protein VMS78_06090 [Rhizomicrobium sp.]|nr:hypothetical protein [Rhizomicrobium sp.]
MKLFVSFIALLLTVESAVAVPCDPKLFPMPNAQPDEVKEAPMPDVKKGCMASLRARASLIGTNFKVISTTRSPKWGHMIRIDINSPNPSVYDRAICFEVPGTQVVQMGLYELRKACSGHIADLYLLSKFLTEKSNQQN